MTCCAFSRFCGTTTSSAHAPCSLTLVWPRTSLGSTWILSGSVDRLMPRLMTCPAGQLSPVTASGAPTWIVLGLAWTLGGPAMVGVSVGSSGVSVSAGAGVSVGGSGVAGSGSVGVSVGIASVGAGAVGTAVSSAAGAITSNGAVAVTFMSAVNPITRPLSCCSQPWPFGSRTLSWKPPSLPALTVAATRFGFT